MLQGKCQYFGKCGGCIWQHLSPEEYIHKKENFIRNAFRDVGLNEIPLQQMILIPTGTRRRASFALQKGHIGFNILKSHQLIAIDQCLLLTPKLNELLPTLRTILSKTNLSGDVFVLDTPLGIDIHIKTKNPSNLSLNTLEILNQLAQQNSIVRLVYNNQPLFQKAPLPATADSFMQPSLEGEQTLIRLLLEQITSEKTAVDLFCGQGTFTHPLLQHGLQTMGYDSSEQAIAALKNHGSVRDLFRNPLTVSELQNIDLVVLDPPRSGALAQTNQLANSTVKKIVMISCSPKTAARDIKILVQNGWVIQSITPVDQFIYSNHIEIIIVLTK